MNYRREGDRIFVRLETGEEVHPTLVALAESHGLGGGWLSGIGAATGVELGYYDLARKEYVRTPIEGDVEVAGVSGSLGVAEGKPFVHLHAIVSDRQCMTRGGHLFRAVAGATLEFVVLIAEQPIERTFDEASGLNLWRV